MPASSLCPILYRFYHGLVSLAAVSKAEMATLGRHSGRLCLVSRNLDQQLWHESEAQRPSHLLEGSACILGLEKRLLLTAYRSGSQH